MIREALIAKYCKGKDVLDVGSVGQTDEYCLWNLLSDHARHLTGIDLDSSDEARHDGFQKATLKAQHLIVQGNMETHDFGKQFEVVVLGDIIEHVENQGLLLRNIRRHLAPGGVMILTTPNAKWPTCLLLKPNPTHTIWHDKYTLQRILTVCGYKIVHFQYYFGNKPYYNPISRALCWRQGMLAVSEPCEPCAPDDC